VTNFDAFTCTAIVETVINVYEKNTRLIKYRRAIY